MKEIDKQSLDPDDPKVKEVLKNLNTEIQKSVTNYNNPNKQLDFLQTRVEEIRKEIESLKQRNTYSLNDCIAYLGSCHAHAYHIANFYPRLLKSKNNSHFQELQSIYNNWRFLTAAAISSQEVPFHYWSIFMLHSGIGKSEDCNVNSIMQFYHSVVDVAEKLEELIFKLEAKQNISIQQEIARKQHDSAIRYWLEYREMAGKLYLNDTLVLASPRLDSPGEKLLEQAFENPNTKIKIEGVSQSQISSALRDMNIKGTVKDIFFPRTSNKHILFRPSITNSEFIQEGLRDIDFKDFEK